MNKKQHTTAEDLKEAWYRWMDRTYKTLNPEERAGMLLVSYDTPEKVLQKTIDLALYPKTLAIIQRLCKP